MAKNPGKLKTRVHSTPKNKYDAILVLGISTDKKLFKYRVERAVNLYSKGFAQVIVFSGKWWGGLKKRPKYTEANLMSAYAQFLGVPKKDIYTEEDSLNTIGNYYFTKKMILEPKSMKNLIVITHLIHLAKAKFIAKKVLGPEYRTKFVTDKQESNTQIIHKNISDIKHFFKLIKNGDNSSIKKLLRDHPYYKNYQKIL